MVLTVAATVTIGFPQANRHPQVVTLQADSLVSLKAIVAMLDASASLSAVNPAQPGPVTSPNPMSHSS